MSFVKNIVIFLILFGVIAGGILYVSRADVVYINVRVNVTELNDTPVPRLENLTAFLVPSTKVSEPKGTPMYTPGIIVAPYKDSKLIGYWTSVPYNGTGTYNLKIGLTTYPEKGDLVLINIRFMGVMGEELNSLTYETELY